jgi:hypothetical protein
MELSGERAVFVAYVPDALPKTTHSEADMKPIAVLAFCALVVGPVEARSQEATTDPVTGTWRQADDAGALLTLKLDSKGDVAGSVGTPQGPAPIELGKFDARSGRLRLEGKAKDPAGASVPYVIDGKIVKGVATGTWQFGEAKGKFTMTRTPKAGADPPK